MEGNCRERENTADHGEIEVSLRRELALEREKRIEAERKAESELQALLQLKSLLLQHDGEQEHLMLSNGGSSSGTTSPFPRSISTSSSIGPLSRDDSFDFSATVFGELSEEIQFALGIKEPGK